MNKEDIETDECPECGSQVVIYKGWATFKEDRIVIPNAKWRCPSCGGTGKLNVWEKS